MSFIHNRWATRFLPVLCLFGLPALSAAQTAAAFTDIAASAGVADSGVTSGAAWGDYDNDGFVDLLITNLESIQPTTLQGNIRLYRNLGDGTFSHVTSSAGLSAIGRWTHAIWGDYDNDGDLDVQVTNEFGIDPLYRNNGNGTFTDVTTTVQMDATGSGRTNASFWVDYDNDGWLDLYVVESGAANRLYRNDQTGGFTERAVAAGVGLTTSGETSIWGDMDNDGDMDLCVTNGGQGVLYRNNGNGTFTNITSASGISFTQSSGGAWGDYDNDGDLDLVVASNPQTLLYRNNGNSTFTAVNTAAGLGAVTNGTGAIWGDVDNDGWMDLYISRNPFAALFYHNNGNGTFTEQLTSYGINSEWNIYGAVFGDYDRDGDLDLYLPVMTGANRLYRNNGNANRWLHVTLQGTQSNRDGVGARVAAVTGSARQRRDVNVGGGKYSQNSLPVEFGFGNATIVDSLIIDWPSGIRQVLTQIAANQRLTIVETNPTAAAFTDIAASAGVANNGTGRGAAWGDHDGDGDLDLYVVNSGQANRLYRNGGSAFTDVAASAGVADNGAGFGTAWGDYDNDGDLDLYVARSGQANRLYRNNGGGSFTEAASTADVADAGAGRGVAWGDYNGDGFLDLYVVNDGTSRLYRNNGAGAFIEGTFSAGVAYNGNAQSAAWGDYDNDGDLDLYLVVGRGGLGFDGAPDVLYRNNGNGTFTNVAASAGVNDDGDGRGAAWGDYDNDGDLDLYVSNSDETVGVVDAPNRLYRNNGNGTFTDVAGVAGVQDINGDGRGVSWGDYDNDGDLDLSLANDGNDRLYRNNANGTFTDVAVSLGATDGANTISGVWGDYDGDGYLDLYIVNDAASNRLYHNTGSGARWLAVSLTGSQSNRVGIGARLTAVAGAGRQRRDVDGGSGYLSQPSLPVEFGFGVIATVDSLIVDWPSGLRQILTNVSTNQHLTLFESDIPPDAVSPSVAFETTVHQAQEGEDYTATVILTDNQSVRDATLFYRVAGAATWTDSLTMTRVSENRYSAVIPASAITRQGTLFTARGRDTSRNSAQTPVRGLSTVFSDLRSTGLSLPASRKPTANDFRMISIPATVANRNPVSVLGSSLNSSDAADYDIKSWRLLRWDGTDYVEHPSAGQFDPGKAFWVIARSPAQIVIPTATTATDVQRSITLRPGWNQIGSPYLFSVPVAAILDGGAPGLVEPAFWHWDGSQYAPAASLDPWQGYWVHNLTAANIELPIPRLDTALVSSKPVASSGTPRSGDDEWALQLVAAAGSLRDGSNYLGTHPLASTGWDIMERSEPPSIGEEGLSLAFAHRDWAVRPGSYATDMRPAGETGYTWTFEVTSGQPGIPVTLEVTGIEKLPPDLTLLLLDTARKTEQDLRQRATLTFTPQEGTIRREFTVIAGSPAYVETTRKSLIPSVVSLEHNQPNPFNPATTIRFNLPEAARVSLRIYNLLGQEVRQLADGFWPAGRHAVQWRGDNEQGRPVASGVYLYQLRTGSFVQTRKMVLLR